MKLTKDIFWINLIFLLSFTLTAFSIYWNYKKTLNLEKVLILNNYPYIKISLVLTIITFLFARISYIENLSNLKNEKKIIGNNIIAYYFIVIVINLILYPGTETLKIHTDPNFITILLITGITQTLTLKCLISLMNPNNKYLKDIIILIIVSLILIFSAKYIIEIIPNSNPRNSEYLE